MRANVRVARWCSSRHLVIAGRLFSQALRYDAWFSTTGSTQSAVAAILDGFSGIDILINNAGISGPNHQLWEYPVDDWCRVIDVNLVGSFPVTRSVRPSMIENGYGRIVNIASEECSFSTGATLDLSGGRATY